jgi:hypothetical protein
MRMNSTGVDGYKFRNTYGSYRYRGLPCTAGRWAVAGKHLDEDGDHVGGGVLEWCTSQDDARERMFLMGSDPQFTDLKVDYV